MASAMTTEPSAPALACRGAGGILYLVSLALLGPFFSPWFGIWSNALHVGTTTWRFGVYGQLAATQFYLFLALGVAALIAARLSHRKVLFGLGVMRRVDSPCPDGRRTLLHPGLFPASAFHESGNVCRPGSRDSRWLPW